MANQQRTFNPLLETDENKNPFADDIKEANSQGKSLRQSHVSFTEQDEEEDKFDSDEENFKKKREAFQKTRSISSRSEHKSILIRVRFSEIFYALFC